MNTAKEAAWETFRPALRRHRRKRILGRVVGAVALACVALMGVQSLRPPAPAVVPELADGVVTPSADGFSAGGIEPLQMAVFVVRDGAMRLEMVDAEMLGDTDLELSLNPVMWDGGASF